MSAAPTIVMTQRGARVAFQTQLRDRGVEVVEFDFLTPEAVAAYCYDRGFLQVQRAVSIADPQAPGSEWLSCSADTSLARPSLLGAMAGTVRCCMSTHHC